VPETPNAAPAQPGFDPLPLDDRRENVEEHEALDPAWLIEGEPVGDAPAAVVAGHGEAHMAELLHRRDDVAAHGALRIGLVGGIALRRGGPAVAA
jgi:hypothetical protein